MPNGQPMGTNAPVPGTVIQPREGLVEAPQDLAVDPEVALAGAQQAARALLKVVSQKRPILINGKRYLTFEDWQTIGRFYGVTVGVASTAQVEEGYAARAVVYNREGVVISAAEAICTRAERTWQQRDEYALKSMAQTRACAKALRNVLAWVAVLAGFAGTPAEEVDSGAKAPHPPARRQAPDNAPCRHCGTRGKYHAKDCPSRA